MASETGHLVFSTIHASTAAQTIGRLLDLFPTERQPLIRQSLAFNLRAVVCQKLLSSCKEGVDVVPAVEVMIVNPIIRKLIQLGEDEKIQDVIRGSIQEGMQDFNQSLLHLINEGLVSKEDALNVSPNPDHLKMLLKGIVAEEDRRIIR
jgi:twitching motility protein PilT